MFSFLSEENMIVSNQETKQRIGSKYIRDHMVKLNDSIENSINITQDYQYRNSNLLSLSSLGNGIIVRDKHD